MNPSKSNIKQSIVDGALAHRLLDEAWRINTPAFIAADPVQFPRRFSAIQDVEIVSLLAAIIAWGNRKMICRDAERLLQWMDYSPFHWVMDEGYESLLDETNVHRTLFASHLKVLLRGLRSIYRSHGSLDCFAASNAVGKMEMPAWELVKHLQKRIEEANNGRRCPVECLPGNLETTALKRVNMALRWLVRDDGIVDMGVWKSIPKSKLFIPLDVHVGNVSRRFGLLTRKANDRKSVELLTSALRYVCPEDPTLLDFALFGLGVEGASLQPIDE